MDSELVYLIGKPKLIWVPFLLLIIYGLAYFGYRKYLVPITERTIDELDRKTFIQGFQYRPEAGLALVFMSILFFFISNLNYFFP